MTLIFSSQSNKWKEKVMERQFGINPSSYNTRSL